VDNFDTTTHNYLTNFNNVLAQVSDGEIIIATHNQDTISDALKIMEKYPHPPKVSFAQLLGLADHLTWHLKAQNLPVYKYLPWA